MASYRIESLGPGTEVPRFGSWGYPWDSKQEEKEESLYQLKKESRHARTHLNINFKWSRLGCNNKKGMNLDEENMRCQANQFRISSNPRSSMWDWWKTASSMKSKKEALKKWIICTPMMASTQCPLEVTFSWALHQWKQGDWKIFTIIGVPRNFSPKF